MSDLSNDATDDGFHEIQLSGKQLVFLFMATTVVSVVIFLCGVLVGRGVRGEALASATKPPMSSAGAAPTTTTTDSAPSSTSAPPSIAEESKQHESKSSSLSDRLTSDKPAPENLQVSKPAEKTEVLLPTPAAAQPAPVAASEQATKNQPTPKGTASTPTPSESPVPPPTTTAAPGVWAVQVVALTDKAAAQAVVNRLVGKGYPAFLVAPQASAAVKNYKVQVGRFEDRSAAQDVSNRLKKEEQFEPWILR